MTGEIAPDLAVEILSESNTASEMGRKRADYFRSGTRAVWTIDPRAEAAEVHLPDNGSRTLRQGDTLTGDPVLPGFSVTLTNLFTGGLSD